MRKKSRAILLQVTIFLFVLFCCAAACADIFDDTMIKAEETLKNIINTEGGVTDQGVELSVETTKRTYSMDEPIEIECTIKNDSEQSRYYWTGEIYGLFNILIFYQHNNVWKFLYLPNELVVVSGNTPGELKSKEFITKTIKLESKDIPQIYFDLQNRDFNFNYSIIFICVTSDAISPRKDLMLGDGRTYPSRERILAKSEWIRIKISK